MAGILRHRHNARKEIEDGDKDGRERGKGRESDEQDKKGSSGVGYRIVGRWVDSPLRWAVVTGSDRQRIDSLADLVRCRVRKKGEKIRVGVSRWGSGSHIMACMLAQREGWTRMTPATSSTTKGKDSSTTTSADEAASTKDGTAIDGDALEVVVLGPLPDLIAGVRGGGGGGGGGSGNRSSQLSDGENMQHQIESSSSSSPAADFFMWEHFTTKPYFTNSISNLQDADPTDSSVPIADATTDTHPAPLKKISEISTPWPSWHIAANTSTFPSLNTDQQSNQHHNHHNKQDNVVLDQFFSALDAGIHRYNSLSKDEIVQMLADGVVGGKYLDRRDVEEWIRGVEFVAGDGVDGRVKTVRGVDRDVIVDVVRRLEGAIGVVEGEASTLAGKLEKSSSNDVAAADAADAVAVDALSGIEMVKA